MKNNNDEAMKNYFDSMLRSESKTDIESESKSPTQTLTKTAVLPEELVFSNLSTATADDVEVADDIEAVTQIESSMQENTADELDEWKNIEVENEFQVLFFELNHVTFAVPLTDLGGIYHLDSTLNFLMGKPEWFSGVMNHNERLYNIVDTAMWLKLGLSAETLQYSHYVLLGSTAWGLSCEKLLGTENLTKDQVRWRNKKGTRPWLAGMVKKKMCALLHAEELVKLLNQGMDISG